MHFKQLIEASLQKLLQRKRCAMRIIEHDSRRVKQKTNQSRKEGESKSLAATEQNLDRTRISALKAKLLLEERDHRHETEFKKRKDLYVPTTTVFLPLCPSADSKSSRHQTKISNL